MPRKSRNYRKRFPILAEVEQAIAENRTPNLSQVKLDRFTITDADRHRVLAAGHKMHAVIGLLLNDKFMQLQSGVCALLREAATEWESATNRGWERLS